MTLDIDALRAAEFPWAARGDAIYLNHASTGPLPTRAVSAQAQFNELRGEVFRMTQEFQFGVLDRSRELIGRLIAAPPGAIALGVNTSFGINLAAFGLPLRAGDVVLGADFEFPANVYPWMAAAERRGLIYRRVSAPDGVLDETSLYGELEDPRVRVVAVSWVGFASGYRVDLHALGAACRARGIYLVVDAIQGVGACHIDVNDANVDVLACGAQKWLLGPWGSGFVYVRESLIPRLEPNVVSWMGVRDSDDFSRLVDYDLTWRDDARRYEQITLPYQDFAGMNASLELIHEVGADTVVERIESLVDVIIDWALTRRDVQLITPRDRSRRAGIVALRPRDAVAASQRLGEARVTHSLREGAIRLSPHFYNTPAEIERTLAVLEGR